MDNTRAAKRQRSDAYAHKYRSLTRSIENVARTGSANEIQDAIQHNLVEGSLLYPKVKKKLDGTYADSCYIRKLVRTGTDAAKRINTTTRPFDLKRKIKQLLRDHDNNKSDFFKCVTKDFADTCLRRPPSFEFFYGALPHEEIVKRERQRKVRERIVEAAPTTARERNVQDDPDEQDSTPKEVEVIERRIKTRLSERPKGLQFFKSLVDRSSFAKTVENIFHVSFLIKNNEVGLKRNVKDEVVIVDNLERGPQKQSILSFSMDDYNQWMSSISSQE